MKLANRWFARGGLAVALAVALEAMAAGDTASGILTYKSKAGPATASVKFAWLVEGPDDFDPKLTIRHLIFSATDIGAKIAACKTVTCMQGAVGNGMTVDLGTGGRLNYWVSLNDQHLQYSGTVPPSALKLTTDTPKRLAGKLVIDDSAADGPKVDITFDTPLLQ